MSELAQALTGDSAAAPAAHIIEGLNEELVHRIVPNVPHTIYEELWHLAFWQEISLDWIRGIETPFPAKFSDGFPSKTNAESWEHLSQRFLETAEQAAAAARDTSYLDESVRCPSRPGTPTRVMSVRDQLISLAAHNAYHLGRIVVLRQLHQAWPPVSGGFSW
jgi:hypothetical protein